MRALSLWQPWASLIAVGAKRYETRGWDTDYRGPLAIHATATIRPEVRQLMQENPGFYSIVKARVGPMETWPRGVVVATCKLVGTRRTERFCRGELSPYEEAFGDYRAGRFAWELALVVPFDPPIPAKGRQGFWEWRPPSEPKEDHDEDR